MEERKINYNLLPNIKVEDSDKIFAYDGKKTPLEQALETFQGKSLFLTADGGIGKTTSLKTFWLDYLSGNHDIPCLYVNLKLLNEGKDDKAIITYLENEYKLRIENCFSEQKPLLLLDGVNEAPFALIKDEQDSFIFRECKHLHEEQNVRLVISSRNDNFTTKKNKIPNLQKLRLCELTDDQLSEAIKDINVKFGSALGKLLHNNMMLFLYQNLGKLGIPIDPDNITSGQMLKLYFDWCFKVRFIKNYNYRDLEIEEKNIYNVIRGENKNAAMEQKIEDGLTAYNRVYNALIDDPFLRSISDIEQGIEETLKHLALIERQFDAHGGLVYLWANEIYQTYFEAVYLVNLLQDEKLDELRFVSEKLKEDYKGTAQTPGVHYYSVLKLTAEIGNLDITTFNELYLKCYQKQEMNYVQEIIQVMSVLSGCGIPSVAEDVFATSFASCESLENLTLPQTIKSIGKMAFYNCINMREVTIPDGIISIEYGAFTDCNKLNYNEYKNGLYLGNEANPFLVLVKAKDTDVSSFIIHNKTKIICQEAFLECPNIQTIVIPESITQIEAHMDYAFTDCNKLNYNEYKNGLYLGNEANPFLVLVKVKDTNASSFAINNKTKVICPNAFKKCGNIRRIKIPNKVSTIGCYAFMDCSSLATVIMGNNLISIGIYAFLRSNVKSIKIPKSVISMGEGAFHDCGNLQSIKIGGSVTRINDSTFSLCDKVRYFEIGEKVTSIANNCLPENSKLKKIKVSRRNIKYYSKNNCLIERDTNTLILGCKNSKIPSSVTIIGENAFRGCNELTSIIIPNSITKIENGAFYDCIHLTNITCPDSVRSIGASAFYHCRGLESIILGKNISYIGGSAFCNCSKISSIEIKPENSKYYSQDNCLIERDTNTLILGCKNSKIPISVTNIEGRAFEGCIGLKDIIIPNSVTSIGAWAFQNCKKMNKITIPQNVATIGMGAFEDCDSLEKVNIENGVKRIEDSVFSGCQNLKIVIIPESVVYIGKRAFRSCHSLESITIPNSIMHIKDYTFSFCERLEIIKIPESVTSIGESAFVGCSSLNEIIIPNSVANIGASAFAKCSKLIIYTSLNFAPEEWASNWFGSAYVVWNYDAQICNNEFTPDEYFIFNESANDIYCHIKAKDSKNMPIQVTIPATHNGKSVTIIDDNAFANCKGIKYIYLNKTTLIGSNAFDGCSGLLRIIIPNSVSNIEQFAFRGCSTRIQSIEVEANNKRYCSQDNCLIEKETQILLLGCKNSKIPDNIMSIGEYAFSGCELKDMKIPNSVTSICDGAFLECNFLTSIMIPNSVTNIGNEVFKNCKKLQTITIPKGVRKIGNLTFFCCENLTEIILPNTITSIGSGVFWGCHKLQNIILPNSITSIGNIAFRFCVRLTSLKLPKSIVSIGQGAFANSGLTKILIPGGVTTVGSNVFFGCTTLTDIYCEAASQPETWADDWLGNCKATVHWGYKGK